MLITISTETFDPLGYVELDCTEESRLLERRRRVTRIATLDGGAVVNDSGYSDADLGVTLKWAATSAATETLVQRIAQIYSMVLVSIPVHGVFYAAIESYKPGSRESQLNLLTVALLSEPSV